MAVMRTMLASVTAGFEVMDACDLIAVGVVLAWTVAVQVGSLEIEADRMMSVPAWKPRLAGLMAAVTPAAGLTAVVPVDTTPALVMTAAEAPAQWSPP